MCTGTLGILQVVARRALVWSTHAFVPSPFTLLLAVHLSHRGLPEGCSVSPHEVYDGDSQ